MRRRLEWHDDDGGGGNDDDSEDDDGFPRGPDDDFARLQAEWDERKA